MVFNATFNYISVLSWQTNPFHDKVYSKQHYVIKFVSDLWQVGRWFSLGTSVSSTNKTDHHDITEILLKLVYSLRKIVNQKALVLIYCII
jgi:hypothetical protein